ncbi:MAG: AAA family ATPase [Anaerolineales bacterium]|nr:AAA family ATPase [Anaerolineales bacterium]
MFSKIEVSRYKCLKRADIALRPFNILIGPNASGKSTFLDSLAFIRDALEGDIEKAVRKRANSLRELTWKNQDPDKGSDYLTE